MGNLTRVRLFGPIQVEQSGVIVRSFESHKVLALLGYLVAQDCPQSRAHLADLFWSDKPEARGRGNLRRALHNLSTLLPDCLHIERDTIQLCHSADFWIDLRAFEELRAQDTLAALTAAVELYRGELMAGLFLDDCPEFETWLVTERERWHQRVTQILHTLILRYTERGQDALGLQFAARLLALDPWREETHRQMMLLLARSGQRSAALAQYETCRRVLAHELRVEPSAETNALFEQIRNGKIPAPSPPPPTIPHNLPVQLTPFIGREEELAKIAARLNNPDCRLLTLIGAGGIGKTRLALQAASANLGTFPDGVYFVPLAPVHSPDLLVSAIADAMRFTFQRAPDPQTQLLNHLREKKILLLLDNLEHLRDSAAVLVEILRNAPQVKILVTSREHLDLQAEWLLDIAGLRDDNAAQLFAQCAERVRADFALAQEQAEVSHICQLIENIPLAIELAAASARRLSCRAIAAQIEQSADFLATSMRDVPERHRSMRAVFDHSWNRLTEEERCVFRRLAVFRGGFDAQAATSVNSGQWIVDGGQWTVDNRMNSTHCPLSIDHCLIALVNKSLLRQDVAGRYEMHELVRQYAEEKLREAGEETCVRARHLTYFTELVQRARPELRGSKQEEWLSRLEMEHNNIRAALRWAVEAAETETGLRLAGAMAQFWMTRGHLQEGRRWLEELLRQGGDASPSVRADALHGAGNLARYQGDHPQAVEYLTQALALRRALGDKAGAAALLSNLGNTVMELGNLEQARALHQECLELQRELGDKWRVATSLNNLGVVAKRQGDYRQAQQFLEECLQQQRELADKTGIAIALVNLGDLAYGQGNYQQARAFHREGLAIFRELGAKRYIVIALIDLGVCAVAAGDSKEGRAFLEESISLAREQGDKSSLALGLSHLGDVALAEGNAERAAALHTQSLTLARQAQDQARTAQALVGLAQVAHHHGNAEKAARLLSAAAALRAAIGLVLPLPERTACEQSVAAAHVQLGDEIFERAWSQGKAMSLEQAIQYALEK